MKKKTSSLKITTLVVVAIKKATMIAVMNIIMNMTLNKINTVMKIMILTMSIRKSLKPLR